MRVFITGTAGFIGFHLARLLLDEGVCVGGYDGMTDYYDVSLKEARSTLLSAYPTYSESRGMLEDCAALDAAIDAFAPTVIVHLAAQAGVRYSLENPRAYINGNLVGTFNVMEAALRHRVAHLLMASTSSVYGANTEMPFAETHKADMPLTIYAASKKANEAMAHSYAHLYGLPITMFRFFTVYGPWGRPDMAHFKFTRAILAGEPIDIYNHGVMQRDFTYIDDLVNGIRLLIDAVPPADGKAQSPQDSLSPVAPYRIVNIGNGVTVQLADFIAAIEAACGREAIRNLMPMQPGDVPATWADNRLLVDLTGYAPTTSIQEGIARFVAWFRDYYGV